MGWHWWADSQSMSELGNEGVHTRSQDSGVEMFVVGDSPVPVIHYIHE